MTQYKFYFLDDRGHVFKAQDHLLHDDLDALAIAKSLCANHPIEIWEGSRQVGRVKVGDAELNSTDLQSL